MFNQGNQGNQGNKRPNVFPPPPSNNPSVADKMAMGLKTDPRLAQMNAKGNTSQINATNPNLSGQKQPYNSFFPGAGGQATGNADSKNQGFNQPGANMLNKGNTLGGFNKGNTPAMFNQGNTTATGGTNVFNKGNTLAPGATGGTNVFNKGNTPAVGGTNFLNQGNTGGTSYFNQGNTGATGGTNFLNQGNPTPTGGTSFFNQGNTAGGTNFLNQGNPTATGGTSFFNQGNPTATEATSFFNKGNTTATGGTNFLNQGNPTPTGGTSFFNQGNPTPTGGTSFFNQGNTTGGTNFLNQGNTTAIGGTAAGTNTTGGTNMFNKANTTATGGTNFLTPGNTTATGGTNVFNQTNTTSMFNPNTTTATGANLFNQVPPANNLLNPVAPGFPNQNTPFQPGGMGNTYNQFGNLPYWGQIISNEVSSPVPEAQIQRLMQMSKQQQKSIIGSLPREIFMKLMIYYSKLLHQSRANAIMVPADNPLLNEKITKFVQYGQVKNHVIEIKKAIRDNVTLKVQMLKDQKQALNHISRTLAERVLEKLTKYKQKLRINTKQKKYYESVNATLELISNEIDGFFRPVFNAYKSKTYIAFVDPNPFCIKVANIVLKGYIQLSNGMDDLLSGEEELTRDTDTESVLQQVIGYYQNVALQVRQYTIKHNQFKKLIIQNNRMMNAEQEISRIQMKASERMRQKLLGKDVCEQIQIILQQKKNRPEFKIE